MTNYPKNINVRIFSLCIALITSLVFSQDEFASKDVFGEYCFTEDDEGYKDQTRDRWILKKYKSNMPYLFTYSKCSYRYSYSVLPDFNYFFAGPISLTSDIEFDEDKPARCMPNYYSEYMVYESYDRILWYFPKGDPPETDSIFGHYFKIKWNVKYDSSYVRLKKTGSARFYISGFCTEEQLKAIQERKKGK